ncbi:MAG: hypothetical protein WBJ10_17560, partial [Daejeonella sp.]|uniref:hypothetical protein n=1 Tax=Daejeonella sp. TaxID=2805397 RepID=UPI003C791C50
AYIERMSFLLNENEPAPTTGGQFSAQAAPQMDASQSDIRPMARYELKALAGQIRAAQPKFSNTVIKSHLDDVLVRINEALDPNPKK